MKLLSRQPVDYAYHDSLVEGHNLAYRQTRNTACQGRSVADFERKSAIMVHVTGVVRRWAVGRGPGPAGREHEWGRKPVTVGDGFRMPRRTIFVVLRTRPYLGPLATDDQLSDGAAPGFVMQ